MALASSTHSTSSTYSMDGAAVPMSDHGADPGHRRDRRRRAGPPAGGRPRGRRALGLSPDELLDAVAGAHALIIRSATQVTDDVLAAGSDLLVVGRAGIGLDNVDVEAATGRGVMVVNAPQSNIVSAAEHTMALLLAQARNVPQAHAALVAGRWERSQVGGCRARRQDARHRRPRPHRQARRRPGPRLRDAARRLRPVRVRRRARQIGVELLPLDQVVAESDFLTIHLPKTPETSASSVATCCSRPSRRCA